MKQRLILIAVGLLAVVAIVRTIVARPSSGGDEVAVDTTGASGGRTPVPGKPVAAGGSPIVAITPSGPTSTPLVVQVLGTSIAVERKPLVLLNPSTVRQGSSLGVTGSGFDPGATVDVVVK